MKVNDPKGTYPFNVRVYGILVNAKRELLVSDEFEDNIYFSKFPGGGLEYGEGLRDGLKREIKEEIDGEIEILDHFYTTDFFVKSAFDESQVISVYYRIRLLRPLNLEFKTTRYDFAGQSGARKQSLRWIPLNALLPDDLTLPIDRHVANLIIENPDRL